jgi:gliding motility-associated-like protein
MDTTGCVPLNSKFKEISTEGPYDQIQWIFGDDTDTLTTKETVYYNFNKLGKYTITAIAELDGCFDTLTRFNYINIVKPPVANFTANKLITTVFDRIITFNNTSTGNVNYLEWNFGDFSAKSSKNTEIHEFPDATNTYLVQLTAYTSPDCYNSKTITIKVNEENICYVPNTFTPDGDEFNNVFIPRFGMSLIPNSYSFLIFNRWGELVFESHDPLVGWDGSYGNKMCPVGTYTWEILYQEAAENKKNKLVGHVNIIK